MSFYPYSPERLHVARLLRGFSTMSLEARHATVCPLCLGFIVQCPCNPEKVMAAVYAMTRVGAVVLSDWEEVPCE
jgi:hypothetical protein